jgi:hypothetical protein
MKINMTDAEFEAFTNVVAVLKDLHSKARAAGRVFTHVGDFPVEAIARGNRVEWFYYHPNRKRASMKLLRVILTFQSEA